MGEPIQAMETKTTEVVNDLTNVKPIQSPTKRPFKKKTRYFEKSNTEDKPRFNPSKVQNQRESKVRKLDKTKKDWKFDKTKKESKFNEAKKEWKFNKAKKDGKFNKAKMDWKSKRSKQTGVKEDIKALREEYDPYPGSKPIPAEKLKKYTRGAPMKTRVKSRFHSKVLDKKNEKLNLAAKQAARAELLLVEEEGYLEAEEGECTADLTQHDLAKSVDITSATKHFELKLNDFGPYRMNYTRNGRFLLLGGGKGHIAAIDWMTKKLMCEINVMETINDVQWLHQETMFAVAQKKWTYIYDNQGIELHCLKMLDRIQRMEFLPYHFLLAAASSSGFLQYIDVSVGQKVGCYNTMMGRLDVMCQNPTNAVLAMGHNAGVVTMWTPNIKEPVVKMLTHRAAIRSIAIDKTGKYLATSGIDRYIKIWDLRTYKMLQSYKVSAGAGTLSFSQKGLLATGTENIVEVYRDCCEKTVTSPYMVHRVDSTVRNVQFCPFEDVLGVGHSRGFQSLLIPGAGEANFDALEVNPYQSKNHRRQAEVKMLLEKVPAELIHLDTNVIGKVDRKSIKEKMDAQVKQQIGKIEKGNFEPRFKQRGKSKGDKLIKNKKKMEEIHKQKVVKQKLREKQAGDNKKEMTEGGGPGSVLDRFKKKKD